jgi:3-carboxy-cis,cis-muconate cycloisomerase
VFESGLLSPVTVGHDDQVSDAAVVDALVTVEVALARAYGAVGAAPADAVETLASTFGWQGAERGCHGHGIDPAALAAAAIDGGNPVIPLVKMLKQKAPDAAEAWVHRGATSQDILDSALMVVARRAAGEIDASLRRVETALATLARTHRDEVAAARTLTQHAVPTTIGLRAANWLRGVRRATHRLETAARALPAQLGGAGGTLAAFAEIGAAADEDTTPEQFVAALSESFASELLLAAPEAPWHTTRWPVTELGDALVQVTDALGVIAADVATASRTEIRELAEGAGGGSSAMPQKQNPVDSVLVRSAAMRAPQLGATLHLGSALAVDERPDGAWHAEWPTLRELLRLVLGSSAHAAQLVEGLRVDSDAVAHNVALTGGLIVSERLALVLGPLIGASRVSELVAAAGRGEDLAALVKALPEASGIDVDALLDPANYTGLAGRLVDAAVAERERPTSHPTEAEQNT